MGMTNWHVETVVAILKNPTYTGYQAYGKSFSNNYLGQKRIQNRDRESYMYRKCDYEPIVSQETFIRAQQIREEKTTLCYTSEKLEGGRIIKRAHRVSRFIWSRKVVDSNDVPYRRTSWDRLSDGEKQFAYINRRRDGSEKPISIPEWKFELMGESLIKYIEENLKDIVPLKYKIISTTAIWLNGSLIRKYLKRIGISVKNVHIDITLFSRVSLQNVSVGILPERPWDV